MGHKPSQVSEIFQWRVEFVFKLNLSHSQTLGHWVSMPGRHSKQTRAHAALSSAEVWPDLGPTNIWVNLPTDRKLLLLPRGHNLTPSSLRGNRAMPSLHTEAELAFEATGLGRSRGYKSFLERPVIISGAGSLTSCLQLLREQRWVRGPEGSIMMEGSCKPPCQTFPVNYRKSLAAIGQSHSVALF